MVYGVCRLMLRDPVEAEDAAQQSFLSAYRALLGGQDPREPSAWLGTIARNECRTRLRGRRTEPLTLVREPVGDELQREVDRHDEIRALCSALAELPPQQRDAIVLREFYGLSYAEVGAALGLSGPAVESVIFRSRKRLQDQLRPARSALGVLTLPLSLRDWLAQALPGFGGGGATAGAGAAALAKLVSARSRRRSPPPRLPSALPGPWQGSRAHTSHGITSGRLSTRRRSQRCTGRPPWHPRPCGPRSFRHPNARRRRTPPSARLPSRARAAASRSRPRPRAIPTGAAAAARSRSTAVAVTVRVAAPATSASHDSGRDSSGSGSGDTTSDHSGSGDSGSGHSGDSGSGSGD